MPDEREMSAPAGAADGSATATGTPAPTATDASAAGEAAGETAEQKSARLEQELERERALRLSHQQKVEEANRRERDRETQAAASPTTAGVASNPLDQVIAGLDGDLAYWQRQHDLASTPDAKREVEALARNAQVQRALLLTERQRMQVNAARQAARPVFDADAKYGSRAAQIWEEGRAATPQDAIMLAKGEAAGDPAGDAAQKAADEAARRAAAGRPSTTTSPVTAAENRRRKMSGSDYLSRVKNEPQLLREKDAGTLDVDWNV